MDSKHFWIGKEFNDREIFIQEFTQEVKHITDSNQGKVETELTIEETK